jgi:hypothetical protein
MYKLAGKTEIANKRKCGIDVLTGIFRKRTRWCIREDYSAAPRPAGRCLRNVITPGAGDYLADHEATN